jgi:hypothetical protein
VLGQVAIFVLPRALVGDPMESYPTRESALEASLHDVQQATIENNHTAEYSSVVYEQRDGTLTYTAPARGSDGETDLGPTLSDIGAIGGIPTDTVHTHNNPGSYDPGLSGDDREA